MCTLLNAEICVLNLFWLNRTSRKNVDYSVETYVAKAEAITATLTSRQVNVRRGIQLTESVSRCHAAEPEGDAL
jgi:hypothetical protein